MAGHVCFGLLRIKKGAGLLPNAWVKIVIPARHRAGRHVFSPARKSVFSHFKKLPNLLTSTYDAGFGLFKFFHLFSFFLLDRGGLETPTQRPKNRQIFTV
jgi:hypothetical protein